MSSNRDLLFEMQALTAAPGPISLRCLSGQLADKGNVDVDFFADSQEKSAGSFSPHFTYGMMKFVFAVQFSPSK